MVSAFALLGRWRERFHCQAASQLWHPASAGIGVGHAVR